MAGRTQYARHGRCGARPLDTGEFRGFRGGDPQSHVVLDCHLVAGDFDYFLKIRVRDMADFNRLHGETLFALPGARQTRTFFVM